MKPYYPNISTAEQERERMERRQEIDRLIANVVIPTTVVSINLKTGTRLLEGSNPNGKPACAVPCAHCGTGVASSKMGIHLRKYHLPPPGTLCAKGCGLLAIRYASDGVPYCSPHKNSCPVVRSNIRDAVNERYRKSREEQPREPGKPKTYGLTPGLKNLLSK